MYYFRFATPSLLNGHCGYCVVCDICWHLGHSSKYATNKHDRRHRDRRSNKTSPCHKDEPTAVGQEPEISQPSRGNRGVVQRGYFLLKELLKISSMLVQYEYLNQNQRLKGAIRSSNINKYTY